MKTSINNSTPELILKSPTLVKVAAIFFISLSLFYLGKHYSDTSPHLFSVPFSTSSLVTPTPTPTATQSVAISPNAAIDTNNFTAFLPNAAPLSPPPPSPPLVERMGLVDETGAMSNDFKIGEMEPYPGEDFANFSANDHTETPKKEVELRVYKFNKCDLSLNEYIPCLDNAEAIRMLNTTERGEKFERHCPDKGKGLDCLVPPPKGYQTPIRWPQSRDEVWYSNVPHTRLAEDKGGQNWITIKGDKFVFPGGGTQFIHGADQYLDQISQMVPGIEYGHRARVALDIGCGVASFGAFLLQRNVTTLSVAPKDVHENQIQFALERGVPAMVAAFATHRLLYPSQAFDFVHCSRCRINWTRDDGILLLEVNRLLRSGGHFIWAAQPVYKHEKILQEQWKEMENLTSRLCWKLVKKEGYIAIWEKPLNNSCYQKHEAVHPPVCDHSDDPDDVWYVGLKPCITKLPDNGYGGNVSTWPERLHHPPDRLQSIKMDAYISRKEIFKAEYKYWMENVESYVHAYRLKDLHLRNVMDMRAGYGGFAAALLDHGIDCWVMNVVPVSGFNTLPVIYDRGLIGVMHDWCEPFDTYPRTYDLLHASGLFSIERKRCEISSIMLEMDRILRPNGRVYIRDTISVMDEILKIGGAMGWVCFRHDTMEGPHASWKLLRCDKRM